MTVLMSTTEHPEFPPIQDETPQHDDILESGWQDAGHITHHQGGE